jgi:LmbE family N-acetylglucosaminyl deacetylase
MLHLSLPGESETLRLLVIGAHSDDIEIGCGGTILRLLESVQSLDVTWVVLAGASERGDEARRSAADFLAGAFANALVVESFRDSFFPAEWVRIKEFFERLKADVSPDLVLTHQRSDLHQDHRVVNELTWNTFRDHLILEYEVPKYDGDFGAPSIFVELTEEVARRKIELLMAHFSTQRGKHWFSEDLFWGLLRLRGMEANSTTRLAEAFYGRKIVV